MTGGRNPLIRPVRTSDLPALLTLNDRAIPHVNAVALGLFEQFAAEARYFGVACDRNRAVGFVIGITSEIAYNSPNFQWFKRRYDNFCYIDRIVVAGDYRGRGLGQRLYRQLERALDPRIRLLACEVNLHPRNDASLEFHTKLGFAALGAQETDGGTKRVQLMMKSLT